MPSPIEATLAPLGAIHYVSIMGKARSAESRKRALKLMLVSLGFNESEIDKYIQQAGL